MTAKKNYYAPMHTAEHILNRTMVNIFNCERSENCHIERKKSKCDFYLPEKPDDEKIKLVEQKVNDIIKQNLKIYESFLNYDDAAAIFKLRVDKKDNPEIRIISIGDYDDCPCIGEHVSRTSEIGEFKITTHDYNPETKILRIRFKVFPPVTE